MTDAAIVPGRVLAERYRIEALLGRGGMAHVYRARDIVLDRPVALKIFRADVADAVDPQRTTREMHLLATVSHPSVVAVLDARRDERAGETFLVMELVDGTDLGTRLRLGPLPADFARRVTGDVASALAELHARGVVHRDVKPANVMVPASAEADPGAVAAKLTDFGIAQMIDATRITTSDSILGTAAYLSPEQVRGGVVGPASDVYALGLLLIECLTGQRAFPGPAHESAVTRLTRPPVLPGDASPALAELLSRMTTLDPGARPAAATIASALRGPLTGAITAPEASVTARHRVIATPAATGAVPLAPSMPTASIPIRTGATDLRPRRRVPAVLAGLAGGAAAVGLAAFVVSAVVPDPQAARSPTVSRHAPLPSADRVTAPVATQTGSAVAPAPAASATATRSTPTSGPTPHPTRTRTKAPVPVRPTVPVGPVGPTGPATSPTPSGPATDTPTDTPTDTDAPPAQGDGG